MFSRNDAVASAVLGRDRALFADDLNKHSEEITEALAGARVLILGAAGSIGRELAKLVFLQGPGALHVVDISENNLVELVRDIRSSIGYMAGETRFLPL